jgi:hypothetical protein
LQENGEVPSREVLEEGMARKKRTGVSYVFRYTEAHNSHGAMVEREVRANRQSRRRR